MKLDIYLQLFLILSFSCIGRSQSRNGLISTIVSCDNEGQEVSVPLAVNNPCLRCMCKDKHVQCSKQECASLKNCYLLLDEDRNKCCNVCKGCFFNGTYIPNDYEWADPESPCTLVTCKSGIITKSNVTCVTSCSSPSPPQAGMCCPTCPTCSVGSITVLEGKEILHVEDPCVTCNCRNGTLTCVRKTCPVLACRPSKMLTKQGDCCPSCIGTRKILETPHVCVVGPKNPPSGTAFKVDECTKCTCVGTTSVCTRANCRKEVIFKEELPHNDRPQELAAHRETNCVAEGKTYENGTDWLADGCSTCVCIDGETRCSMKKCSVTKCAVGYRLDFREDPCCPVCVDDHSTCSVFGHGYIKSFDGHVTQFVSAPCKYLLAGECDSVGKVNETQFAISIAFRGKQSKRPVFSIHLQDTTINLGRYHQVRVNGVSVPLPHVQLGLFSLVKESFGMVLRTNLGLRVFWDGVNLLNVTVAATLHKSACGLCGNLNNDLTDELRLRNGQAAPNAKEWISSWRVGSLAGCKDLLPQKAVTPTPNKLSAFKNTLPKQKERTKRLKRETDSEESSELSDLEALEHRRHLIEFPKNSTVLRRIVGDNSVIIRDRNRRKRDSQLKKQKKQVAAVEGDLSADLAKFTKKNKSSLSKGVKKPPVMKVNEVVFDVGASIQGHLKPRVPQCSTWSKYFRTVAKCNEIGSFTYSQCHKKLKPSRYQKICIRSACSRTGPDFEGTSTCDSVRLYSSECRKLGLAKSTVKIFCQSD